MFTGAPLRVWVDPSYWRTAKGTYMQKLLIAAIVSSLYAGAAFAQTTPSTTPPAATTPAPSKMAAKAKAKPATPAKERSAESLECSKQADTKGLHGKERKTFRSKCIKDLKKKT